jgi:hypothetical protein
MRTNSIVGNVTSDRIVRRAERRVHAVYWGVRYFQMAHLVAGSRELREGLRGALVVAVALGFAEQEATCGMAWRAGTSVDTAFDANERIAGFSMLAIKGAVTWIGVMDYRDGLADVACP